MSVPHTMARPEMVGRGRAGSSPRSVRPSTLLPEPDSPTSPTISPGITSSDTPRRAWTAWPPRMNDTCNDEREMTGSRDGGDGDADADAW